MFFGGDPFEHFAHHGGGGSHRGPRRDVDTTKLYETLGVSSRIHKMTKSYSKYIIIIL